MKRVRIKYVLVFILLLVAGLTGAGWVVLSRGFSARDEPSSVEAFVARSARHLAVPHTASELASPVPSSPEALSEAMAHFADHCAFCHANDGSGHTAIGRGLYPKPPDMREHATQDLSDGEIYYVIENGVRLTGMPAFGDGGPTDEASWKLVQFIRHLPSITPDELEQMKEMNPKTPEEMRKVEEIQRFLRGEDAVPPTEESSKHHEQ